MDGELKKTAYTVEEVINVATIRSALGYRFRITGVGLGEARDLALLLRAGALAAPMYIVEERTVGASLGEENVERGLNAAILGFVLIVIFMMFARGMLPAQEIDDVSTSGLRASTGSSYFCITKSGALTMMVNVWGYVRLPGRYEISTSTDLVQLISCAGGPGADATISDVWWGNCSTRLWQR